MRIIKNLNGISLLIGVDGKYLVMHSDGTALYYGESITTAEYVFDRSIS